MTTTSEPATTEPGTGRPAATARRRNLDQPVGTRTGTGTGADRGSATLELVLAVPLLLLMLLFVAQAAVWMHGTHVAQAAAARGAEAARAENGTAADGTAATKDTLTALGSRVVVDPRVTVTRDGTQARVRVDADAATVVPRVRWPIKAEVAAPIERFVPDPGTR